MQLRHGMVAACAAALCALSSIVLVAPPAEAAVGIRVSGGRLVEANGSALVLRGVNVAHAWYPSNTSQAFGEIKAIGANAVRVVLGDGKRWGPTSASEVSTIISQCKANRLICMLEVHDTTGYGEDGAAGTLAQAAQYWTSIASALQGQENYVLINIGNEPFGNSGYSAWASDTSAAIRTIRAAGLQHTLVVDAPNWGQDWSFTMRDNAQTVAAADSSGNTVFSIHMYGVFDTAAEITSYVDAFASKGLALMVGEFGHNHSDGNPDEATIFSYTASKNLGWLAWSWCGNGSGVEYLDLEAGGNCTGSGLTSWGSQVRSNLGSAREASIYSGQTNTTTTTTRTTTTTTTRPTTTTTRPTTTTTRPTTTTTRPTTTTTRPTTTTTRPTTTTPNGGSGTCSVSYTASQWTGGFVANVDVTTSAALNGWSLTWTFGAGQQITNAWNATITRSGSTVTAANVSYNGQVAAGQRVSFGFQGTWSGSNPTPADFALNGRACG